jgi:putative transposase
MIRNAITAQPDDTPDGAAADAAITEKIAVIHEESGGTYGSPRIRQALRKDEAVTCGKRRVARLMRTAGLEGRREATEESRAG